MLRSAAILLAAGLFSCGAPQFGDREELAKQRADQWGQQPRVELGVYSQSKWFEVGDPIELSVVIFNRSEDDIEVPSHVFFGPRDLRIRAWQEGEQLNPKEALRPAQNEAVVYSRIDPSALMGPGGEYGRTYLPEEQRFEVRTIPGGGVGVIVLQCARFHRFALKFDEACDIEVSLTYQLTRSSTGFTSWVMHFPTSSIGQDLPGEWKTVSAPRVLIGVSSLVKERDFQAIESLIGREIDRREYGSMRDLPSLVDPDTLSMQASGLGTVKRKAFLDQFEDATVSEYVQYWETNSGVPRAWIRRPVASIGDFLRKIEEGGLEQQAGNFLERFAGTWWVRRFAGHAEFTLFRDLILALVERYPNSGAAWRVRAKGWLSVAEAGYRQVQEREPHFGATPPQ